MGLLRLLLALSVVITHFGPILGLTLVEGQIAVQTFYIISGFYMSLILNQKYIGLNNSYKLFITNRFMRIYPIYLTVLLITILSCIAIYFVTKGQSFPKFEKYMGVKGNLFSFSYLILSNLLIFGQDVVMFLGIDPTSGHLFFTSNFRNTNPQLFAFLFVPQAWTLALELTFYLIAPFILRKGYKIVVTLIILSILLRLFIYYYIGFHNDPWSYRFFPTEILFFLLGYLAYQILLSIKPVSSTRTNILILLVPISFTLFYSFIPPLSINNFPFSLKDLLYFSCITVSIPFVFNFLKKNRFDNQIGELSYPVYISHLLVGMCCGLFKFSPQNTGWIIAVATIAFSILLNKFIAVPIEKFRQSRLKNINPK